MRESENWKHSFLQEEDSLCHCRSWHSGSWLSVARLQTRLSIFPNLVIYFLGFKRENPSKCPLCLSKQLTISISSLGNFVPLLTFLHLGHISTIAERTQATCGRWCSPLSRTKPTVKCVFPLRRVQGKLQAGKERAVQPCPQAQDSGYFSPGSRGQPVRQIRWLILSSVPRCRNRANCHRAH